MYRPMRFSTNLDRTSNLSAKVLAGIASLFSLPGLILFRLAVAAGKPARFFATWAEDMAMTTVQNEWRHARLVHTGSRLGFYARMMRTYWQQSR